MPLAEAVQEDIAIDAVEECPLCGKNPQFNAETIAAIEEGRAICAGIIPAKRYHSVAEAWEDIGF